MKEHNSAQRSYFEGQTKPRMLPDDTPYLQRHVDRMLRFTGLAPGDRVLDVGCGMGRYTLLLARRGLRVEGVDLCPALLEHMRGVMDPDRPIPLHAGDIADEIPGLRGPFDAVVGFFMLHHVHDLTACFKAMRRLVRPGGQIAFLEPNAFSPLYYLQLLFTPGMTWEGDGGIVQMRRGPLFEAMSAAGFEQLRLEREGVFPPLVTNRRWGGAAETLLEHATVPLVRPFQLIGGRIA